MKSCSYSRFLYALIMLVIVFLTYSRQPIIDGAHCIFDELMVVRAITGKELLESNSACTQDGTIHLSTTSYFAYFISQTETHTIIYYRGRHHYQQPPVVSLPSPLTKNAEYYTNSFITLRRASRPREVSSARHLSRG